MAQPASDANPKKERLQMILAIAILLLLVGVSAAAIIHFFSPNEVEEARAQLEELRDKAFKKDASREERREAFKKSFEIRSKLTLPQQKELDAPRMKKRQEELDKFFKLSPEQQVAELDKKIDEMLARREKWKNGGGWGGRGGKGRAGQNGQAGNNQQAGANQNQGPGPGGPWGRRPKSTPEQRELRAQMGLDFTTPQFQAQMTDYRSTMRARMDQRGITGGGGPFFGGFGGGPGGFGGRGPR